MLLRGLTISLFTGEVHDEQDEASFRRTCGGTGAVGLATLSNAQESPVPKPTPEHERLARDVGTWYATIKSWMQGPGSEPSVSKGVEVAKMMPGGLWVLSEFHGKFGDTQRR